MYTTARRSQSHTRSACTAKDDKRDMSYRVSAASSGAAFGQKLTRGDWKKKKELEEAREADTASAEVDEEGR